MTLSILSSSLTRFLPHSLLPLPSLSLPPSLYWYQLLLASSRATGARVWIWQEESLPLSLMERKRERERKRDKNGFTIWNNLLSENVIFFMFLLTISFSFDLSLSLSLFLSLSFSFSLLEKRVASLSFSLFPNQGKGSKQITILVSPWQVISLSIHVSWLFILSFLLFFFFFFLFFFFLYLRFLLFHTLDRLTWLIDS